MNITTASGNLPYIINTIPRQKDDTVAKPAAKPSKPSIRLKALINATIQKTVTAKDMNAGSS